LGITIPDLSLELLEEEAQESKEQTASTLDPQVTQTEPNGPQIDRQATAISGETIINLPPATGLHLPTAPQKRSVETRTGKQIIRLSQPMLRILQGLRLSQKPRNKLPARKGGRRKPPQLRNPPSRVGNQGWLQWVQREPIQPYSLIGIPQNRRRTRNIRMCHHKRNPRSYL
jgi:hypothetical protein